MYQETLINQRGRLNQDQVDFYNREGYLMCPEPMLPQTKFDRLKEHFEKKLAALPPGQRPEAMDVPHFTDPALFEWLFADEILDVVESIIGPDIALFSSHFICKPAGNGKRVPWHEDGAYWNDRLDPMKVVTVWLAVDPSRKENGCMKVIPRTHLKQKASEYEDVDPEKNVFRNEVVQAGIRDVNQQVYCELEENHASLHDAWTIHGSEPNLSTLRRCGYTMRFMPTSVKHNTSKWGNTHLIYLARGKDRAGNVYADPKVARLDVFEKRMEQKIKEH